MQYINYEGIHFKRDAILVVSGPSIDPAGEITQPFFRIILQDNVEWRITAKTDAELDTKREKFLKLLLN